MANKKHLSKVLSVLLSLAMLTSTASAAGIGVATHMGQGRPVTETLSAAKQVKATWVRDEIRWDFVETSKGNYKIPSQAEWVSEAKAKGMNTLAILAYGNPAVYSAGVHSNSEGASNTKMPVDDGTADGKEYFDAYINYVKYVSTTLGDKIDAYEIWNEPDITYFNAEDALAADYAKLLKAAYDVIKVNDPTATVVGVVDAGTDNYAYTEATVKALNGTKAMDAVSFHYYLGKNTPESNARDKMNTVRKIMEDNNLSDMPIWVTETGYATSDHNEATQAKYILRNNVIFEDFLKDNNITGEYFSYELRDSNVTEDVLGGANYESSLGLFKQDYTPKVSAKAVSVYNKVTADKDFQSLSDTSGNYVAEYGTTDKAYVAWRTSGTADITKTLPAGAIIYNYDGTVRETVSAEGSKTISISDAPTIIDCNPKAAVDSVDMTIADVIQNETKITVNFSENVLLRTSGRDDTAASFGKNMFKVTGSQNTPEISEATGSGKTATITFANPLAAGTYKVEIADDAKSMLVGEVSGGTIASASFTAMALNDVPATETEKTMPIKISAVGTDDNCSVKAYKGTLANSGDSYARVTRKNTTASPYILLDVGTIPAGETIKVSFAAKDLGGTGIKTHLQNKGVVAAGEAGALWQVLARTEAFTEDEGVKYKPAFTETALSDGWVEYSITTTLSQATADEGLRLWMPVIQDYLLDDVKVEKADGSVTYLDVNFGDTFTPETEATMPTGFVPTAISDGNTAIKAYKGDFAYSGDGYGRIQQTVNTDGPYLIINANIPANKTVTVSFVAKDLAGTGIKTHLQSKDNSWAVLAKTACFTDDTGLNGKPVFTETPLKDGWVKYSTTATLTKATTANGLWLWVQRVQDYLIDDIKVIGDDGTIYAETNFNDSFVFPDTETEITVPAGYTLSTNTDGALDSGATTFKAYVGDIAYSGDKYGRITQTVTTGGSYLAITAEIPASTEITASFVAKDIAGTGIKAHFQNPQGWQVLAKTSALDDVTANNFTETKLGDGWVRYSITTTLSQATSKGALWLWVQKAQDYLIDDIKVEKSDGSVVYAETNFGDKFVFPETETEIDMPAGFSLATNGAATDGNTTAKTYKGTLANTGKRYGRVTQTVENKDAYLKIDANIPANETIVASFVAKDLAGTGIKTHLQNPQNWQVLAKTTAYTDDEGLNGKPEFAETNVGDGWVKYSTTATLTAATSKGALWLWIPRVQDYMIDDIMITNADGSVVYAQTGFGDPISLPATETEAAMPAGFAALEVDDGLSGIKAYKGDMAYSGDGYGRAWRDEGSTANTRWQISAAVPANTEITVSFVAKDLSGQGIRGHVQNAAGWQVLCKTSDLVGDSGTASAPVFTETELEDGWVQYSYTGTLATAAAAEGLRFYVAEPQDYLIDDIKVTSSDGNTVYAETNFNDSLVLPDTEVEVSMPTGFEAAGTSEGASSIKTYKGTLAYSGDKYGKVWKSGSGDPYIKVNIGNKTLTNVTISFVAKALNNTPIKIHVSNPNGWAVGARTSANDNSGVQSAPAFTETPLEDGWVQYSVTTSYANAATYLYFYVYDKADFLIDDIKIADATTVFAETNFNDTFVLAPPEATETEIALPAGSITAVNTVEAQTAVKAYEGEMAYSSNRYGRGWSIGITSPQSSWQINPTTTIPANTEITVSFVAKDLSDKGVRGHFQNMNGWQVVAKTSKFVGDSGTANAPVFTETQLEDGWVKYSTTQKLSKETGANGFRFYVYEEQDYLIDNIKVTNADGTVVYAETNFGDDFEIGKFDWDTTVQTGKKAVVRASNPEHKTMQLFIAEYGENNRLVNVKTAESSDEVIDFGVALDSVTTGNTVKAFLWEKDTLRPFEAALD